MGSTRAEAANASMIAASKYQSYGNDYLVIRESDLTRRRAAALTRDICRRHFGIGGDGCVFVEPAGKDRFRIRIFNPDGSEAAMSGNGCRCAGALVHHRGWSRNPNLILETLSGVKVHRLLDNDESSWRYRSSLGRPSFIPEEIPIRLEGIVPGRGPPAAGGIRPGDGYGPVSGQSPVRGLRLHSPAGRRIPAPGVGSRGASRLSRADQRELRPGAGPGASTCGSGREASDRPIRPVPVAVEPRSPPSTPEESDLRLASEPRPGSRRWRGNREERFV